MADLVTTSTLGIGRRTAGVIVQTQYCSRKKIQGDVNIHLYIWLSVSPSEHDASDCESCGLIWTFCLIIAFLHFASSNNPITNSTGNSCLTHQILVFEQVQSNRCGYLLTFVLITSQCFTSGSMQRAGNRSSKDVCPRRHTFYLGPNQTTRLMTAH